MEDDDAAGVRRSLALETFTLAGAVHGARMMLPVAASAVVYGAVSGILGRQVGLSLIELLLMSALVFSGSMQFTAFGIWAYPLPVASLISATIALNLRHLMLGAVLRPRFTRFNNRQVYPSLLVMTDENWALSIAKWNRGERDGAVMIGSGIVLGLAWVGANAFGYTAGNLIGDPERFGLDFAATIVFAGLLALMFRGKHDLIPWLVAAAVAIAADHWMPGNWYIILGGLAGCAAGIWRYERG